MTTHTEDKLDTCPMCGEEMLYWQLQNHIVIYHANIERWNYSAGDTLVSVCSQCAQNIIEANGLKQIDWHMWSAKDDGTDLEHDLWKNFRQSLAPFKCVPCWERNH